MTQDELDSFDYKNPPVDGSTGWSFEVNLHYPKELHGKTAHQTFPLAAETRTLTKDDLSETSKRIFCQLKKIDENKKFAYSREKLISSFHDREKYITSHHNLKFFLDNGLVMKGPAVRGITYTEKSIFKPHIDRCSTLRANASSKFMQRVLKLMSNVRILVYIHSCFPRSNIYTFLFVFTFSVNLWKMFGRQYEIYRHQNHIDCKKNAKTGSKSKPTIISHPRTKMCDCSSHTKHRST
jgi:hypothetical protein